MKTHSIRLEISVAFISTMLLTFILWFVINFLFMGRFYVQKKKENVIQAYKQIESAISDGDIRSDIFNQEIRDLCVRYSIEMLVMDTENQIIKTSSASSGSSEDSNNTVGDSSKSKDYLSELIWDNIMQSKRVHEDLTVLDARDNYTLQIYKDNRNDIKYLEIWGIVGNKENFILVRSTMESIEDSVGISNTFMAYAGTVAIFIGSMIVLIISKKITDPIKRLYLISDEMKELNFEAKYDNDSSYKNEIDILGQNMNELSETLETAIKDLKNANIALKHDIAKKEEIDEMRKEFLSNVSHELKTPIALIQGYAEGLKEGINDDEESRNFYCEVIMDEASKMNIMVKKLLTLNQLEFGNDSANMERFDIVEMIKNYVRSAELLAKQKNVTVKFGRYHPIFVWGDEFKIEEVLQNYYSNALNHVSGDNIIEIKLVHKDGKVRVSVFNTGDPIPKENIDYIWDKFYKVDRARTREYGGSGVGLSIVKAIMESMQQNYGVINYANGVEFYFELETK